MHIKKIVIQGFKTYKNTTIIDDISPGHNVVVGRNGSGKSNFFAAIRFVLSDQYTRMSKEERQGLIHEGSGTVLSAYVEIVFDNLEGRFPTGKDEVVIRRTIGLKKDDYSLDYKSSTRTDIMQLLESAGFSKSNPYYIVPQGRITSLTNAKDLERLNLLKEVAGAKVFETKLKESQKEMVKTKSQREKIDEMLEFIQERLADLDSEKDELKVFQDLEKNKKIYEFVLYDRDLNEITTSIESIDSDYQTAVDDSHKFLGDLEARENLVRDLNTSINSTKNELKLLNIDNNQHSSNYDQLTRQLYEKSATLNEIRDSFSQNKSFYETQQSNLIKIETKLEQNEQKLNIKRPIVESLRHDETQLRNEIAALKAKQNILYSKKGRYSTFSTRKDRDEWISAQIYDINTKISEHERHLNEFLSERESNAERQIFLNEEVDKLQDSINGPTAQAEINDLENNLHGLKRQYLAESDLKRTLWREETRSKTILESLDEEVRSAERQVNLTMDRQQSAGLEAVRRITKKLGLSGVYGTLGELISVNQKYRTAVEVVAGNSLFHVVVENDEVATTLMEELVREKAGRVTFMPLNRIRPKSVTYPESSDSVPLIKKIAFENQIENAVKQIFGKTIVAINLERGYELSREFKLNAITLDGDKADKKGVLTGGYHNFKRSRLESLKLKQEKSRDVIEHERRLLDIKSEISKKDQEILHIHDEISKATASYENLLASKKPLKYKLSGVLNEKFKVEENLKLLDEQINKIKSSIKALKEKSDDFIAELASEFKMDFSESEEQALVETTSKLLESQKRLDHILDKLATEETELENLEAELSEDLRPRLQDILKRQASAEDKGLDIKIQDLTEEVETIQEQKDSVEQLLRDVENSITVKNAELAKFEATLAKADDQQRKLLRTLENFQRNSEKYLSKRSLLSKRRDETQRKIRELGALPEEAFEQDSEITSDDLLKNLNKVIKELEKFSHVNRKALDQYLNFTKKRNSLVERRKELDNSEKSIVELIQVLESRKEEAIQRTFEQVSAAFTEVFEKLVPEGVGKLIMQTENRDGSGTQSIDVEEGDDDLEVVHDSEIDNYSGVSIQVSFNSKSDEQQRIEQLSGGQKSLCAIALILAIQKSDPAPFYLFDEIDANLDTQYRTAVANLIHELSADAQFICTTFRPEMLQVANKFFGVMFNNKISTVSEIEKSDALNFVEGQQKH